MISAKGESPRSARSRRSLPASRRVWPYVLIAIMLVAVLAAAGAFWYLRDSRRPSALSLESIKNFFRTQTATLFPPSRETAPEKSVTSGKTPTIDKAVKQKKKSAVPVPALPAEGPVSVEGLRADNENLAQQLQAMAPTGYYVIINTAGNRVVLHNGEKVEAEMIASCGSGNVLEDPKRGRRWTFDTPRGVFTVKSKVADPVWIKPDWAFIEEGEPIPKNRADRAEPGMMGDFAIGIGDGYYLHGTLYSRLLGRNVSHGCVRLGDADIDRLYHTLNKGDRVYIF